MEDPEYLTKTRCGQINKERQVHLLSALRTQSRTWRLAGWTRKWVQSLTCAQVPVLMLMTLGK